MRLRASVCLLLVVALGAQALRLSTVRNPSPTQGLAAGPATSAPPRPQEPAPALPPSGKGKQRQQLPPGVRVKNENDGTESQPVEKPLTEAQKKIAQERAENVKAEKIGETLPWMPLVADAENFEIEFLTKLGQASGKKLKSLTTLMVQLAQEAADGLRDGDQVLISKNENKPVIKYQVEKGKYDSKRPNTPGFAALATKKMGKLQSVMCKKPNGDVKKICSSLLKAKQKITDFLTGKIAKFVDFVKDVFDISPSFLEEKADSGAQLDTKSKYKIYSQGAHHEQMICEALKVANYANVFQGLQDYITAHFTAATDCDNAISKSSSTMPQWWATIGARWQDVPCFGSDAVAFQDDFVETCYRMPSERTNILGYRSHISDRVYWHSMTSAEVTLTNPQQWNIRETIIAQARDWLIQATTHANPNTIAMKPFLWNLGRVSHMIGDSFACGHCIRDAAAPYGILFFQDYAGQSAPWTGEDHAYFDSKPQVGVNPGTVRVRALNEELVAIFLAEATRVITGNAYVPATAWGAGAANGQIELSDWMRNEVYNFYSNNHRDYQGLGCQVKSTTKNRVSACPQNLMGTPDPANICPDFPRAPNTEFL